MIRVLLLGVVVLVCSGCGRIGFDWLYDHGFVVTTPEDRLAGPDTMASIDDLTPGTAGLSLREALVIAANNQGTDLVRFDPRVFPPGSDTQVVLSTPLPTTTGAGTVVDGSDAGVVIDGTALEQAPLQIRADGVRLVGVTIVAGATPAVDAQQVRDLRIERCSLTSASAPALVVADSEVVEVLDTDFISGANAVELTGCSAVRFADNRIVGPGAEGLHVQGCTDLTVENNRIEEAGGDLAAFHDCARVVFKNNFLVIGDKEADRGVHFERTGMSRIVDNIIDPGSARLIDLLESSDNHIEGNILDGGHAGVVLEGGSNRNMVLRNVAMDCAYDGVYVSSDSTGNTYVHNTILRCSTAIADGSPDLVEGNNLVSTEATDFVDPVAYDFRLVEGSPGIDAATDMGFDLLPNDPARFLGAAPDLGAVETR